MSTWVGGRAHHDALPRPFLSIELLVTLKPLIRVPLLPNVPTRTLVNTLVSIGRQSEQLSALCAGNDGPRLMAGGEGQSPGKTRIPQEDQDRLDGEGVNIWNRSGQYRLEAAESPDEVFGASESTKLIRPDHSTRA
jgi:hypothetical protein